MFRGRASQPIFDHEKKRNSEVYRNQIKNEATYVELKEAPIFSSVAEIYRVSSRPTTVTTWEIPAPVQFV